MSVSGWSFLNKEHIGGKAGVDLVAQTVEDVFGLSSANAGMKNPRLTNPTLDSLLDTSSKTFINDQHKKTASFAMRLWVSTTNKWGSEAKTQYVTKVRPFSVLRLSLSALEEVPVD